jgi:hypothetical protein
LAQEIEVVCKRNEARSPFLAAFLNVHLPDVKLSSSGVATNQGSVNNMVARNIATEWGFGYTVSAVEATSGVAGTRLHLPVDTFVQTELQKILAPEQILGLELEKISSEVFEPLDPVNCNQSEMKYELSKLLGFGVLQLRQIMSSQFPSNIEAITPQNPLSSSQIYSKLLERQIRDNLIVVDASLKESNRRLIKAPDGVLQVPLDLPLQGAIYSSIFEFPEAEKVLCSLQWRDWLTQLTGVGKVIIVTPPLVDEEGQGIHDSHLAAIWADKRRLI